MEPLHQTSIMIYLASPYTHPEASIVELRYNQLSSAVVQLVKSNTYVFSPILHWHSVAVAHTLPTDHTFWRHYNYSMMTRCDEVWILMLPGWEQSLGVQDEIEFCKLNSIPLSYKELTDII